MNLFKYLAILAALSLTNCATKPDLPYLGQIQRFTLTDQTGRDFESSTLKGKVWVANFIFTNCMGPCPRMSSQMSRLRKATARENVRFVSFTVDPARDTPEILAEYGKRFGAGPDWFFLTGPQPELHRLTRKDFMLGDVDSSLLHSTRFVLVDGAMAIRGFYDSSDPESLAKIERDLAELARGG